MTSYFSDIWLAYLCEHIVRDAVNLAKDHCLGCKESKYSPLLHLHEQTSLLDKIRTYFEEIRGRVLSTLPDIYDRFKKQLAHTTDLEKDKESYVDSARKFLLTITPDAVYFGRYIDEMTDSVLNDGFKIKKVAKVSKKRKVSQSEKNLLMLFNAN